MTQPQGAHLVGSINFDDAETTIRTAAEQLGDRLKRIPDGEVGERFHWIAFQPDRIAKSEGIERVGDTPIPLRMLDMRQVRIADGVEAQDLQLASLGYADAALESYEIFARLKAEGVMPAATRFQVSLPTPLGVVGSFVRAEDRPAFEPVYEAALAGELERILDAIPHDQLAIQWDAALEFAMLEGLEMPEGTELYLGLVHREDAAEGAARRIETAKRHVTRAFGVATECGFGRAPEGTTIPLFEAHRAVAAAW